MEARNTCCAVCTTGEAQCTCICQFPLPALCSSAECASAHVGKKSTYFHYLLPFTATYCVTARNHRSYQQWVLALHHAQTKVIDSLAILDAAVVQIEESYQRQVATLATLKDQYIARVYQLKTAATEVFNSAVRDTAQNALNSEYVRQSDVSEWIWTMASKAEDDEIPLFYCETRETTLTETGQMFAVKLNSIFQSLADFNIDFPCGNTTAQREELERLKVAIESLEQRTEMSEAVIRGLSDELKCCQKICERLNAEVLERALVRKQPAESKPQIYQVDLEELDESQPITLKSSTFHNTQKTRLLSPNQDSVNVRRVSHCYTCNSEYTSDDDRYQCRSQCQCKVCTVETLIGRRMLKCLLCHEDFSRDAVLIIQKQFKRCHVCGIAVPLDFIAAHIQCSPCLSCVIMRGVNEGKTLGRCIECPGEPFLLRKKEVKCIQEMKQIGTACCERANDPLRKIVLRCGHVVCKIHRATLLVCRVCRKRTQLS